MTNAVPAARESGTFLFGFFTSPAVKVMLFQASEENREPTCATQNATNKPNRPPLAAIADIKETSGLIISTPRGVQRSVKLDLIASACRPTVKPIRMRTTSDNVLAEVKIF